MTIKRKPHSEDHSKKKLKNSSWDIVNDKVSEIKVVINSLWLFMDWYKSQDKVNGVKLVKYYHWQKQRTSSKNEQIFLLTKQKLLATSMYFIEHKLSVFNKLTLHFLCMYIKIFFFIIASWIREISALYTGCDG